MSNYYIVVQVFLFYVVLLFYVSPGGSYPDDCRDDEGLVSRESRQLSSKLHEDKGLIPESRQISSIPTIPFIQRRVLNTSVALTIPILSFLLPQTGPQFSPIDLTGQLIYGLFSSLVWILVWVVPVLFTGIRPIPAQIPPLSLTGRHDDDTILGRLMGMASTMKSPWLPGFEDLKNEVGLEWRECLQKTICEAHRSPRNKIYNLLALPFQIFFPPPLNVTTGEPKASSFQMAAKEGKYSRKECRALYHCFFDILDLAKYIVDWANYKAKEDEF